VTAANKVLEEQNKKLRYQVETLKRAVREGDDKLQQATAGK